ncbi:hypothetical protein AURDEDRAFT_178058 [Auricularia subglabra TFB-10046 SS5]|uniref:F-box domain-containing protein n=1 Tax=Auricularia subglabra (strain TFB-10046 / SS5) TaxID=717982 RepID=J0CRG1_AURST|nr:hypothetical protein AURDEDRAFT_178058 [Auricularia subglabra TFB-10046 SS5]
MEARHQDRFVDYVRRVGLHALYNRFDPMFVVFLACDAVMCPEDVMGALKLEIVEIVHRGLARAGREWNARRGVNRVPLELVGLICSHMTLEERERASHMCANWRSAVVSNPALWNVIDDRHATEHGLPRFLERSASTPVSLTCLAFESDAMAYWVENHLKHIRRLTVGVLSHTHANIILRSPAPILEVFTLRCPGCILPSDVFGGRSTRLTDLHLGLVRLPVSAPVSAFLTTRSLRFEPGSVREIDLAHIFSLFPALEALTLDTSSCSGDCGPLLLPPVHSLTHVILNGSVPAVRWLVQCFRGRVRSITVSASHHFFSLVITPRRHDPPARRLTWLHNNPDATLDSITVYQSSEPWRDQFPELRCFQRIQDDLNVDLGSLVMAQAYRKTLTSLVIHDTFWPESTGTLPAMTALQLLTVLCAAKRLRPDVYFAKKGSATLECPALRALCLGAIERNWGGHDWKKVPSKHASFFIREILGFGTPCSGGRVRKVNELAFMNLTLLEEEREEVEGLADRIWFGEDPGWDGLWF